MNRILKEKEVVHVSSSAESISVDEDEEREPFRRARSVRRKKERKQVVAVKTKATEGRTRTVARKGPGRFDEQGCATAPEATVEADQYASAEELLAAVEPLVPVEVEEAQEGDSFEMEDLRQQLEILAEARRQDREEARQA